MILRRRTPVDNSGREIELPHPAYCFRGIPRDHHFSARSLQRSLKIERNEGLLLDHEDCLSIETDAFHGYAVPSRADTYAHPQGFIVTFSTEALLVWGNASMNGRFCICPRHPPSP